MIGYILTIQEKDNIQGQHYAPFEIFNCVQDINGVWFTFLTQTDKQKIAITQYEWLLLCPIGEYIPNPQPPFTPIS